MGFRQPSAPPPSMMHRKMMDQFAKPRQPSVQIQHELAQARKAADANAPPAPKKVRTPKAGG